MDELAQPAVMARTCVLALGAGMTGRRIMASRPYASPEDLVTKRFLKKVDLGIIKAAITAR
jgi:hypothetical protein